MTDQEAKDTALFLLERVGAVYGADSKDWRFKTVKLELPGGAVVEYVLRVINPGHYSMITIGE